MISYGTKADKLYAMDDDVICIGDPPANDEDIRQVAYNRQLYKLIARLKCEVHGDGFACSLPAYHHSDHKAYANHDLSRTCEYAWKNKNDIDTEESESVPDIDTEDEDIITWLSQDIVQE